MADTTVFVCPGCDRNDFKSLRAVKTHFELKKHKLFCDPCQKGFTNVWNLLQHTQKHQKPDQKEKIPSGSSPLPPPATQGRKRAPKPKSNPKPLVVQPVVEVLPFPSHPWSPAAPRSPVEPTEMESLDLQIEALNLQPLVITRTNRHAVLGLPEQSLYLRYLLLQCHNNIRLRAQGFIVETITDDTRRRPSIPKSLFLNTPAAVSSEAPRKSAVVLDCEMVQVADGLREVAYITAIDFLTGDVLLDHYVQPDKKVVSWDTRYSGVTCDAMKKAVRKGQAIMGWRRARQHLWKFVGPETVLIGHSLNNDLDVLGIVHPKIVDSSILTSEAVFNELLPGQALLRTWSLKTLTQELAGYEIQTAGKKGHSAYEDTMATRDILIWCIRNQKLWAIWSAERRDAEKIRALEHELAKIQAKLEQVKINKEKSDKEREEEKLEIMKLAAGLS
ncbi:hypothetical protein PENANT_c026G06424 [Penicillium antarcticum]|uniref:C2H2-type domain-containing protein n=1 Tax=Penicillium antarcticum TaxID=416450 RepID=A0A1V6PXJ3_9EURO|nr:uncharacterized protein N7508_000171 [Penicillium antarcticum]KAJ5319888.1 hypothetical protein N7508_000171 [Penicillium antarcticum]OQD81691.1 hypothetical protein PENANT_c026G06424 [Penicillium antarcticum]